MSESKPSKVIIQLLRDSIKGGYKPTLAEKELLRKYGLRAVRTHPRAGFNRILVENKSKSDQT